MNVIYTSENCPKCEAQKTKWDKLGIEYEERNADRIKNPQDEADREALVEASMQDMALPVILQTYNPVKNEGSEE